MEASTSTGSALVSKPKQLWLNAREFLRDVNAEMKKVTFPTRKEVGGTTVVVLIATVIFALYLWGVDLIFYQAIDFLFSRFGAR
ncbi:MAG TPA: preprotein translocase subunit SecE [Thermoanaerobaculia bacterium]|nr:preprotein translocase subunit SecE [Thermoanaerobaculia bacterium]